MTKYVIGCVLSFGLLSAACQRKAVEHQVEELREAQQEAPEVARELEQKLEQAKADVINLEKKLALAREGVTDEVLEERQELKEALSARQKALEEDVNQLQREAKQHNSATTAAQQALERTQPAHVEANINTDTQVQRQPSAVDVNRQTETIDVERVNVSGRDQEHKVDDATNAHDPSNSGYGSQQGASAPAGSSAERNYNR